MLLTFPQDILDEILNFIYPLRKEDTVSATSGVTFEARNIQALALTCRHLRVQAQIRIFRDVSLPTLTATMRLWKVLQLSPCIRTYVKSVKKLDMFKGDNTYFKSVIDALPNLKKIDLQANRSVERTVLKSVLTTFMTVSTLKHLSLTYVPILDLKIFSSCTSLEHLMIESTKVSNKDLMFLNTPPSIRKIFLETLCIKRCTISTTDILTRFFCHGNSPFDVSELRSLLFSEQASRESLPQIMQASSSSLRNMFIYMMKSDGENNTLENIDLSTECPYLETLEIDFNMHSDLSLNFSRFSEALGNLHSPNNIQTIIIWTPNAIRQKDFESQVLRRSPKLPKLNRVLVYPPSGTGTDLYRPQGDAGNNFFKRHSIK